jgi:type IV secretory pathway VirB2 component (pilin)
MGNWLAVTASDIGFKGVTSADTALEGILNTVYFWAGAIAVIVIIIAGFQFVTSGGDEQAVNSARYRILGAVVGLVVIAFAFVITGFIMNGVK